MEIRFIEVELRYTGGSARLRLTPEDVVGLVALADKLRGLVPVSRAVGSGADNGCARNYLTASGFREAHAQEYKISECPPAS